MQQNLPEMMYTTYRCSYLNHSGKFIDIFIQADQKLSSYNEEDLEAVHQYVSSHIDSDCKSVVMLIESNIDST